MRVTPEAHRQAKAAYMRVYRDRHRERLIAYSRDYYAAHRESWAYHSPYPENTAGQWIGHCGVWQQITALPHLCACCGVAVLRQQEESYIDSRNSNTQGDTHDAPARIPQ